MLVGFLVFWSVGWFVGWVVGWLAGWLVDRSSHVIESRGGTREDSMQEAISLTLISIMRLHCAPNKHKK